MKQTIQIGKKTLRCDFGFLFILIVLFGTSCFALYNAFNLIRMGSGEYYLRRQILWYGAGFLTLWLMSKKPNKFFYSLIPKVYQYLMVILVYLLASKYLEHFTGFSLPMANDINGAYSWIQIPGIGSFQASEFMKVILILKTSLIVSDWQKKYPNPTVLEEMKLFGEIIKWALPPMILILLEPDTGVFIIIAFTLMVLICCSGIRTTYIWMALALISIVVGGFFILYFFYHDFLTSVISAYQLRRIDAWLYPDQNILSASNQLYTALLSLGSAGLSGHGLQASIISIPEAHTDFIFAAFGQCFGLIGTSYILIVCLCLDLYLCKMAYNSKNTTNRLIIIGTIAMLLYQQIQNLGMIIGLIPITGITLPLISYGGSSTLSYFILFGIILNLSPVNTKGFRLHPRLLLQAIIDLFTFEEDGKSIAVLAIEKPKQALSNRLEQAKQEKEKHKGQKNTPKKNLEKIPKKDLFVLSDKEKALFAQLEVLIPKEKKETKDRSLSKPTSQQDLSQEIKPLDNHQKANQTQLVDFFKEETQPSSLNPYEIQSSTNKPLFIDDKQENQPKDKDLNDFQSSLSKTEENKTSKSPLVQFDQLEKLIQLGLTTSEASSEKEEVSSQNKISSNAKS